MPCILKVRIVSARNLPVMDRATELTDAFVEIKFSDLEVQKTSICRRTLNPVWEKDFRFEISDDADLQNEPLEIKVMDYDQITYNDAIGTVFIDLNPLLSWDSNSCISGWFPIFDTLRGVRGELNAQIKLQFFGDINPFKDSSAGVQFFSIPSIPSPYQLVSVCGLVSAVITQNDPEYDWNDSFRTPRTSNEARARLLFQLSGQLRRQLGKKVLEMNGNTVLGFKQYFDLETKEKTITARAIGTAVRLVTPERFLVERRSSLASVRSAASDPTKSLDLVQNSGSAVYTAGGRMHPLDLAKARDEALPTLPSDRDMTANPTPVVPQLPQVYRDPQILTLHEFPPGCILGMGGLVSATSVKIIENNEKEVRESWWTELREEIKSHARTLGCAFVVGYSEHVSITDEVAVLHCSGTAIVLDTAMLNDRFSHSVSQIERPSIIADRAVLESSIYIKGGKNTGSSDLYSSPSITETPKVSLLGSSFKEAAQVELFLRKKHRHRSPKCQSAHISYRCQDSPFPMAFTKCASCKKRFVPEVLLTTVEPLMELETIGKGMLIEAHVLRQKKSRVGDSRASIISESLPFAQYDIHRQLMYKLRIYGLNAIFGLKIEFTVGESLMTATARGTAVFVKALPSPPVMKVFRNLDVVDAEDERLLEIQRQIMLKSEYNRKQIEAVLNAESAEPAHERAASTSTLPEYLAEAQKPKSEMQPGTPAAGPTGLRRAQSTNHSDSDSDSSLESDEDNPEEATARQRTSTVIQIDDEHDEDLVLLLDAQFPETFSLNNVRSLVGCESNGGPGQSACHTQMITMVKQSLIDRSSHHPNRQFANIFKNMYKELQLQLSYFSTCVVSGITYDVQLPKENEVQVCLNAIAMGYLPCADQTDDNMSSSEGFDVDEGIRPMPAPARENTKTSFASRRSSTDSVDEAMVFDIEEVDSEIHGSIEAESNLVGLNNRPSLPNVRSDSSTTAPAIPLPTSAIDPSLFIEITPLPSLPNAKVERFLGRISMHFIKEATMIYESGVGSSGMGGFTHIFLAELYSIARAHTAALGGNALVAFTIDQCLFSESIKNQGYALISISGDVVESHNLQGCTQAPQMPFTSRILPNHRHDHALNEGLTKLSLAKNRIASILRQ
ncbi:uncharacterized protein BJ171DRAFT_207984 [Polychytrium aggregatum]|uniref:uncharacterized protein n=1 Tax=Polychytrium aggregatum TaxID=110093 RepID=UPI0022FDDD2B|nr:uncharacterized protein BJ171DRAFT_207984 [Polychytrium aggregatum]KAI9208468.1 hypothetical protein BJ171DRAFT_207984 [Polychytrium aggregatum]